MNTINQKPKTNKLETKKITQTTLQGTTTPIRMQRMAVHAHKHGDESNDALQQRFKKQVQKTGLLKTLRERCRFKKYPTKRLIRSKAVVREKYRARNRKKQFYSNM